MTWETEDSTREDVVASVQAAVRWYAAQAPTVARTAIVCVAPHVAQLAADIGADLDALVDDAARHYGFAGGRLEMLS